MEEELSYAFIIRMHYPENSEAFERRFALFRTITYPRIKAQSDQEFDLCIWCNEWQKKAIKNLDPEIKTFNVSDSAYEKINREYKELNKKRHVDWTEWDEVRGLEQYDVQMGLDSDDIIMSKYVETIKNIVDKNRGSSLHFNVHPLAFDLKSLSWFTCPLRYPGRQGSAFFALYQPGKENYRFAYEYSHIEIGKYMDRSITLRHEALCALTVHGENASTKLFYGSRALPAPTHPPFRTILKYFINTLRRQVKMLLNRK